MEQFYKCNHCSATFTKVWNLQRHKQSIHQGNKFNCSLCPATFTRSSNLQQHMYMRHENGEMNSVSRGETQDSGNSKSITDTGFYFMHPFSMIVAAGSGFGKSYWVKRLLAEKGRLIQPIPQRIVWCYNHWQPLYEEVNKMEPNIEFIEGLPLNLNSGFFDNRATNLLIVDDMMTTIPKDNRLTDLYTRGSHHDNLSVICLLQNLYYKNTQTMRRNSHYLVLFDMPMDKTQVKTMS